MTGMRIDVDDRVAQAALQALLGAMQDMTPLMEEIGEDAKAESDLAFRDSRSPFGIPWARLSLVTRIQRVERGQWSERKQQRVSNFTKSGRIRAGVVGDAQILRDTGRLAASISVDAGPDSVEIGSNLPYAPTHQLGAKRGEFGSNRRGSPIPWGDIPARPFLPMPDSTGNLPPNLSALITQRFQAYIDEVLA